MENRETECAESEGGEEVSLLYCTFFKIFCKMTPNVDP
jgi:hypothetical protein